MQSFRINFKNLQLSYEMTQPPKGFCDGKLIFVGIISRADMEGYLYRMEIRKSWLKKEVGCLRGIELGCERGIELGCWGSLVTEPKTPRQYTDRAF
jgi:hypothetical protein